MEEKLLKVVKKFMLDNHINCEETIWQCDWVIQNALPLIENLYNIVKDDLYIIE